MDNEKGMLGDKLGGFRPEPDPEVWNALEAQLQKRRKKRPWAFFWLLGGLATMSALLYWWPSFNKSKTDLASQNEQNQIAQQGEQASNKKSRKEFRVENLPNQEYLVEKPEQVESSSKAKTNTGQASKSTLPNQDKPSNKPGKISRKQTINKTKPVISAIRNEKEQSKRLAVQIENESLAMNPGENKSENEPESQLPAASENVNTIFIGTINQQKQVEKANTNSTHRSDSIARSDSTIKIDSISNSTRMAIKKDSTKAEVKSLKFSAGATGFYTVHRSWSLNEGQENRISLSKPNQAWRSRMAFELSGKGEKIIYKGLTVIGLAGVGYSAEEIAFREKSGISGYDQRFDPANNIVYAEPRFVFKEIRIRQEMLYSHLSLGVGWQNRIIHFSALAGNLLPLWTSGADNKTSAFNLFFQTQLAIKASRNTEIVPQLRWNPKPMFNYQNRSTHRPLHIGLGLMRTF